MQREFREIKGTTVIIYDQTCATEKRRRRKRGTMVDPAKRVVINELVCEGCGDCSVQSNCLSVEPLETEFGRKRQINQSTCNKDMSCLKGFCPSFVTVEGGQLRKKKANKAACRRSSWAALPEPVLPAPGRRAWGIVVAGVGGTGVITIGQLLGVAAHMEGKGIVTQDAGGLAQKGGATWSHVLIGATQDDIRTTRVGMAAADLIIGCDPIVTAGKETVLRMREGRTHVALNSNSTPTAAFVKNANWQNPARRLRRTSQRPSAPQGVASFNADAAATKLLGDSIYTNPMMLGYAWQKGWIPLGRALAAARDRAQRGGGRQQQGRLRVGPPAAHDCARSRSCWRAGPGAAVQEARDARTSSPAASSSSPATRTRPMRAPTGLLSRRCASARRRWARRSWPKRGALPVQADGLQGRVRGGAPAHRHRPSWRASTRCSRATSSCTTTWRRR
jgi:indolepyruvate ferredoxin oxidoreductase